MCVGLYIFKKKTFANGQNTHANQSDIRCGLMRLRGVALHRSKMSDCKEDYVAGSDVEEVVLPTVTITEMDNKLNNINEQVKSDGELYVKLCYYPLETMKFK